MGQAQHGHFDVARLLLENHWLTHAQRTCKTALTAEADGEGLALLAEIERRLQDETSLNLSRDHAPVSILMEKGCIISTLHFRHLDDELLKREAFRQAVHYIDIETSSQCNRKCLYCPNSQNDRFSSNQFMADSTFDALVRDLGQIQYRQELHFVGYNEPLLHIDNLISRIKTARQRVPDATIIVFTNGDYLESEGIDQLVEAGAHEMIVSVHLPPGRRYNDEDIFHRMAKVANRIGTQIVPFAYAKDRHISARLLHDRIKITMNQSDYERYGSNRASTLENVGPRIEQRTAACLMPIHQFIVGHKGAVVPCCVMVSDDPRNSKHLVGNIAGTDTIFDVYCSDRLVGWRRGLYNLAPKEGPCKTCAWDIEAPVLNAPALYNPWQQLVSPTMVDPIVIC